MPGDRRQILSLVRLPVPPLQRVRDCSNSRYRRARWHDYRLAMTEHSACFLRVVPPPGEGNSILETNCLCAPEMDFYLANIRISVDNSLGRSRIVGDSRAQGGW